MDDIGSFGDWLKQRRKALDLTQEELARRASCAAVTVHKIEADGLRPSRQMAAQLAAALELAPAAQAAFVRWARGDVDAHHALMEASRGVEPGGSPLVRPAPSGGAGGSTAS